MLLLVAAGAAGLTAGPAAAKDFSITSVSVDATVKPNGDVRITDTRTLDFSGTFHFVYWDLSDQRLRGHRGARRRRGPRGGDPGTTVPYRPSQVPDRGRADGGDRDVRPPGRTARS